MMFLIAKRIHGLENMILLEKMVYPINVDTTKPDDEVDELERLRRENLRLKRQLEEKDMVVELLKKVKEFEGM